MPSFSRRRTGAERKNNHYSGSDEQNDEHAKQNLFGKASLGIPPAPLFISLSQAIPGHFKSLRNLYKIKSHPARLTYPKWLRTMALCNHSEPAFAKVPMLAKKQLAWKALFAHAGFSPNAHITNALCKRACSGVCFMWALGSEWLQRKSTAPTDQAVKTVL